MLLTKSKYLIGLQCPKYLWIVFHEKDRIPEPDAPMQYRFDEGTLVGEWATKLFSDGIDLSKYEFKENLVKTKEALKERKPIFEAGFMFENLFSRGDILAPNGDSWDIYEVKSSTKLKDINVHDVSFQKYVYEKCGLKIKNCYLVHINNKYVRKGEIEPEKLFIKLDITKEVNEITNVEEKIEDMFEVVNCKEKPSIKVGEQCSNPYSCPIEECFEFLPEDSVTNLHRLGKKSFDLIEAGIFSIKDIPEDYKLTAKQKLQKECEVENKIHVNKEGIKHFLSGLNYPLYYLDFETFNNAVPMFDDVRPYQQVPFQFSLHVDTNEDIKHYSYLSDGEKDPREEFILELKKVLGDSESIVVYNESFERNRLLELGELFPEHKEWVDDVIGRFVDLLVVFRNFLYYNPIQKGSASIKKVLPALTNESYEGMEIGDGATASVEFYNMTYNGGKDVRKALLKYCELDTLGMVYIMDGLRKV